MTKVLIITYYWAPAGGSGVQRWLKFVKYLPGFHWEPIVLTVDSAKASYPQIDTSLNNDVSESVQVIRTKTFEILNLFNKKKLPQGGITNEKKSTLPQKIARFIRGNFFLPDPRKGWNRYAYKKACELIEKEKITHVVTTSPPHSTQLIGLKLKKNYPHIKWIADFRDPWTDIFYYRDFYPTHFADNINRRYERKVLEAANVIITVSEGCKRIFASKNIPADKIVVINNGYDEEDFTRQEHRHNRQLTITYTGIMTEQYNISAFIEAVKKLAAENPGTIKIRLVGNVPHILFQALQHIVALEQINYVPHAQSINYLLQSDILLLVIPQSANNKGILTGKIFEYLAARKPILCIAPINGDAADIIRKCHAGETFDYTDTEAMYQYLLDRLQRWQSNNDLTIDNEHYRQFSRKALTQQLAALLT